ncbi:hypothetical protein FGM00_12815 [Aggregatimonas sangjinii]|uniref:Uncharacterized protein n=1 Tax=Aggregatimonas sangjinii TaxID=2583587 RepID=A0A5B7SUI9_9FLAO|nr:hypothetical protein [Aggregatimonas sangjinii]QCX00949.1 hypothetical protein FGM00_12815 [Aggregatimonas sangjinii]
MVRRQTQFLGYRNVFYRVLESRLKFGKDPESGKKTTQVNCTIKAQDIVEISPWIMDGGLQEVFLITHYLDKQENQLGYFKYCFYNASVTEYREEFDKKLMESLLKFSFVAESVTALDEKKEMELNNLLNSL